MGVASRHNNNMQCETAYTFEDIRLAFAFISQILRGLATIQHKSAAFEQGARQYSREPISMALWYCFGRIVKSGSAKPDIRLEVSADKAPKTKATVYISERRDGASRQTSFSGIGDATLSRDAIVDNSGFEITAATT